ncbi:MAG: hypothetical protein DRN19_01280, partial [Thermoplasmata archaeon]
MKGTLIVGILCLLLIPNVNFDGIESGDSGTRQQIEIPVIPDDVKTTARERLSQVRVACFYMT